MMRTWKLIGLNALLAAMLAAAPALAEDPPKNTDKPEELQKQLKGLRESVDKMNEVLESMKTLPSDMKNFRADYDRDMQSAKREINDLREDLRRLKSDVESLRKAPTGLSREAGFAPGMTTTPNLIPIPTGRVQLSNTWGAPVSVIVNGRSYPVLPGEVRFTDPVPAGTFSYEVIGITPPNNVRTLAAGETYRINVYPR
jgi:archaellum component FlaC